MSLSPVPVLTPNIKAEDQNPYGYANFAPIDVGCCKLGFRRYDLRGRSEFECGRPLQVEMFDVSWA